MDNAVITALLTNGDSDTPVTLDADGLLITRIVNASTQKLIFTASAAEGYEPTVQTYDLSGLTLEAANF